LSALVTHMIMNGSKTGEMAFDLDKTLNGALTGLVAVTAGAGVLEPWAAVFVGVLAGWVYLGSSALLIKRKVDDAVDAIPVHLFGGALGLIAVGLLASTRHMEEAYNTSKAGFLYTLGDGSYDASLLANEVLALLFIAGWNAFLMCPFFYLLSWLDWLRSDTLEEIAGLDAAYQVATQEDNDELKKKIKEEFQVYKKKKRAESMRLSEASKHSTDILDTRTASTGFAPNEEGDGESPV